MRDREARLRWAGLVPSLEQGVSSSDAERPAAPVPGRSPPLPAPLPTPSLAVPVGRPYPGSASFSPRSPASASSSGASRSAIRGRAWTKCGAQPHLPPGLAGPEGGKCGRRRAGDGPRRDSLDRGTLSRWSTISRPYRQSRRLPMDFPFRTSQPAEGDDPRSSARRGDARTRAEAVAAFLGGETSLCLCDCYLPWGHAICSSTVGEATLGECGGASMMSLHCAFGPLCGVTTKKARRVGRSYSRAEDGNGTISWATSMDGRRGKLRSSDVRAAWVLGRFSDVETSWSLPWVPGRGLPCRIRVRRDAGSIRIVQADAVLAELVNGGADGAEPPSDPGFAVLHLIVHANLLRRWRFHTYSP